MADLYFDDSGDIVVDRNGDLAITPTVWREFSQSAFIRIMTQQGDFLLYPELGADLERLIGMPQSRETADYGRQLILNALAKEAKFTGSQITVEAVPESMHSIRFDVYVTAGSKSNIVLSIEQDLGVQPYIDNSQYGYGLNP